MRALNRGFSLIEVLVSVVILSIGLLGVAAMQLAGLQYSQGAYQQSQATVAIADLIDRMRANPDLGAASGGYQFTATDAGGGGGAPADCDETACTPSQLAQHDVQQWLNEVLPQVGPGASASVALADGIYTVTVNWSDIAERDGNDDPAQRSLVTEVRL